MFILYPHIEIYMPFYCSIILTYNIVGTLDFTFFRLLFIGQLPPISVDVLYFFLISFCAPSITGYGTHYAYAYVGSPPQRQSLIIDTGSHYTAFPCTGCKQCGEHTDAYFDVAKSKTANVPK